MLLRGTKHLYRIVAKPDGPGQPGSTTEQNL